MHRQHNDTYRTYLYTAPTPTFFMDKFTFYTRDDRWIESNIRIYVDRIQIASTSKLIGTGRC